MAAEDQAFWRYACALYENNRVRQICLQLQDGPFVFNVNLLLFGCYAGSNSHCIDAKAWQSALAAIGEWESEVLQPMRRLRRHLKSLGGTLYDQIKGAELLAEKHEQKLILAGCTQRQASAPDLTRNNLRSYADILGAANAADVSMALDELAEIAAP